MNRRKIVTHSVVNGAIEGRACVPRCPHSFTHPPGFHVASASRCRVSTARRGGFDCFHIEAPTSRGLKQRVRLGAVAVKRVRRPFPVLDQRQFYQPSAHLLKGSLAHQALEIFAVAPAVIFRCWQRFSTVAYSSASLLLRLTMRAGMVSRFALRDAHHRRSPQMIS